ncbi:ATG C terminal domain-containing protein [Lactarius hatsudake]|nr:ATG C terminal domain-containing protein [Lactarius hatsudake]
MINDDLPSNLDYLDVSFGTAAGLRELDDDDLDTDDSSQSEITGIANPSSHPTDKNIISRVGGETVKLLDPSGLQTVENFFNTLPALVEASPRLAEELSRVVIRDGDVALFLYEGYDWVTTLAKHTDPSIDPTNTLLFNSIHVGLDQDADEMDPDALIAAIDEQLKEDTDAGSVSSWQSLRPSPSGRPGVPQPRLRGRRLTRSRSPSIEIRLSGLFSEAIKYVPNDNFVTRTFATVRDAEILDHVKTSTWRKFLTALRSDSRGNIRETGSNMVRIELCSVHPVPGNTSEETRLRAKILPLRLHVDQDALDFLKKFFNFQNPTATPDPGPKDETYLQRAEVFPVALKLDYKPRRVDYRALRDGRTIELMNFFHFDGAEMTLRHITLFGVAGWPRFFDMLNDLWTPDVKATQLADVISGVSPIRSVVNVGSGVADLVLLPIAQYRKDGRVVRGLQKGTKAFVRSTAMEAVKLGAQLATGTQVILEQAENVLGSKFNETVLAETVSHPSENVIDTGTDDWASNDESTDPISKYAEQPVDIRDGIESAYTSMRRNLSSAAQTILAVPMEGPVRAVIRAVPIAVLRPMIGASEAVSKTLLGLHNSMDPEIRHENAAKYKHR